MMLRKAGIALLVGTVLTIMCGCGLKEKEETWEYMELTQEEKEMLCNVYIDDERINQGELLSYQRRTVEQYRYAKEVLERKYPSYSFQITYCEPQTIMNEYMKLLFLQEGNDEDVFTMEVYEEKEGYYAKDNFYGEIFAPKYDEYVCQKLQEAERDVIATRTGISSIEGEEYDENMTVEDVLSGKLEISPDTSIFILRKTISEEEGEEIVENIQNKIINEMDLYGAYQVMIIDDEGLLEKEQKKVLDDEEYLYRVLFQNFNRGRT